MGKVIQFAPNKRSYAHVVCLACSGELFTIAVSDDSNPVFEFIICEKCGNSVPINMTPCFSPGETAQDK